MTIEEAKKLLDKEYLDKDPWLNPQNIHIMRETTAYQLGVLGLIVDHGIKKPIIKELNIIKKIIFQILKNI